MYIYNSCLSKRIEKRKHKLSTDTIMIIQIIIVWSLTKFEHLFCVA